MTFSKYLTNTLLAVTVLVGISAASASPHRYHDNQENLYKEIDEDLSRLNDDIEDLNRDAESYKTQCAKKNNCASKYLPYYTLQYCSGSNCAYQPVPVKRSSHSHESSHDPMKHMDGDFKDINEQLKDLNEHTAQCLSLKCSGDAQYVSVYTLVQCASQDVGSCGPSVPPTTPPSTNLPPSTNPVPPTPVPSPAPPAQPPYTDAQLISMVKNLNVQTEAFFGACDGKVIQPTPSNGVPANGYTSESKCNTPSQPCLYCEYTLSFCQAGQGCPTPNTSGTRVTTFAGHNDSFNFDGAAQSIIKAKAAIDQAIRDTNKYYSTKNPSKTYQVDSNFGDMAGRNSSASCYYAQHYYGQEPSNASVFRMSPPGTCY